MTTPAKTSKTRQATKSRNTPSSQAAITRVTNHLLVNIRSVKHAQDQILKTLSKAAGEKADEFIAFTELHSKRTGRKTRTIEIPVENYSEFKKLVNDTAVVANSVTISVSALFLILVSKWDAFIGGLLRWVYDAQPDIINGSGRSILYTELLSIGDMDAAREKIIDDEISSVLRESHISHFEYLENKLKIPLTAGLDIWPQFVELTQRRHLVAHTDGHISNQYLQVCGDNKVALEDSTKAGARLTITPDYFVASCDCLTELSIKLSQVVWRKLQPELITEADRHLVTTTFDMIQAEQYGPAVKILSFAIKPPMKFKEARDRLRCIINLAQAYKWSKDEAKCKDLLDAEDWSAASTDFLLAVAVLREDHAKAARLMKQIGANGDVTKEDYENWPVFREFRKTQNFIDAYEDVFKTKNETKNVPSSVASLIEQVSKKALQ